MKSVITVAKTNDLAPGEAKCVEVAGRKVALFNVDGSYHAIGEACTHVGGSLSEGELDGQVVLCSLHCAEFDVTSGRVVGPPADEDVPCYTVKVDGEDIQIEVP